MRSPVRTFLVPALCVVAMPVAWAGGPSGGGFELTRTTIDGGGQMRATGLDFEVSGTIGQPDAGLMSGGGLSLAGGFWIEIPAGDCEDDGDVDLLDYAGFESCLTGPNGNVASECRCYDINGSGSVDLADFALAQLTHTGS